MPEEAYPAKSSLMYGSRIYLVHTRQQVEAITGARGSLVWGGQNPCQAAEPGGDGCDVGGVDQVQVTA